MRLFNNNVDKSIHMANMEIVKCIVNSKSRNDLIKAREKLTKEIKKILDDVIKYKTPEYIYNKKFVFS